MGRYMGLDFGSKTVGVALTDALNVIVSPEETIVREREGMIRPTLRRIVKLVQEKDVECIIVGDPVHMDGYRGERSEKSRKFAEQLEYRLQCEGLDVKVGMWDERLTTAEADEILAESEVAAKDRKTYIDKIAAALILEDYLKQAQHKKNV